MRINRSNQLVEIHMTPKMSVVQMLDWPICRERLLEVGEKKRNLTKGGAAPGALPNGDTVVPQYSNASPALNQNFVKLAAVNNQAEANRTFTGGKQSGAKQSGAKQSGAKQSGGRRNKGQKTHKKRRIYQKKTRRRYKH
jgi:hypothetical protein